MKPDERTAIQMTGYDIRNAMNKAYGIPTIAGRDEKDSFVDVSEGTPRLHRFLVLLMMAMKGGM